MSTEIATLERTEVERTFGFRQVDILAKVTEYFGSTGIHGDPTLRELHWQLHQCLQAINRAVTPTSR